MNHCRHLKTILIIIALLMIFPIQVIAGQYKVVRVVDGDIIVVKYGGKYDDEFRFAEKLARKEKLNIWGDPELTKKYLRLKSKWGDMENIENVLSRGEVRAFIFEIINAMSDEEMRQLFKDLENWQKSKFEMRKHPRRSTHMDITYSSDQRRIFEDFVRDISAGGLYIETNLVTELGQKLTMTFSHPDTGDPIKILGKIVRVDPNGIGVKFSKLLSGF